MAIRTETRDATNFGDLKLRSVRVVETEIDRAYVAGSNQAAVLKSRSSFRTSLGIGSILTYRLQSIDFRAFWFRARALIELLECIEQGLTPKQEGKRARAF